jgi:nucleotide-binding universal stress UspA family protein
MYKHILVATDGSKLSRKAIATAVSLANALGSRLTGVYVIPPFNPGVYGEAMMMYVPALTPAGHRDAFKREGKKALDVVDAMARAAGLDNGSALLAAEHPWEGVIRTAKAKKCDLIVMASHGRRGIAGLVLGSETTKVLTHSKIPVLVCR